MGCRTSPQRLGRRYEAGFQLILGRTLLWLRLYIVGPVNGVPLQKTPERVEYGCRVIYAGCPSLFVLP